MEKKWIQKSSSILLVALVVAVLWGSAYPGVKIGFEWFHIATEDAASKILFAGIRFFLAGAMVVGFASVRERRLIRPTHAELPHVAALGLILTSVQYIFYYIGLAHISASKGAILFSCGTFLAVLSSPLLVRGERLTLRKVLGCCIGFAGVVFVNGGSVDGGVTLLGEGFILIAAASFGLGSTWSKTVSANSSPTMVTGYQMLIGGAVLCILGPLLGGRLTYVTLQGILLLLYLSFLSAAAFSLWTLLLKHNDVGKVTVYNFLVPVFGTALSGIFLHEDVLTLQNLLALALVCLGIVIVNLPHAAGKQRAL